MPKLVILDGHALIHRCYHAVPKTLRLPSGELVNAVYGFASILLGILQEEKPDFLAVALDEKGPTFRHASFDGYKETRTKTDDELISQFPQVYGLLEDLKVPLFREPGLEADDFLGLICEKMAHEHPETHIVIVTGDQDALQLVNDQVEVVCPISGYTKVKRYNKEAVVEKLGIFPNQVPDYKGLCGDSSDNLPGVPGIGPKGAVTLLTQYGTIEGIYEHLQDLPSGKTQETLEKNKELAFLCKQLATILREKEGFFFSLEACAASGFDFSALERVFEQFEFRSLIPRLQTIKKRHAPVSPAQASLF